MSWGKSQVADGKTALPHKAGQPMISHIWTWIYFSRLILSVKMGFQQPVADTDVPDVSSARYISGVLTSNI